MDTQENNKMETLRKALREKNNALVEDTLEEANKLIEKAKTQLANLFHSPDEALLIEALIVALIHRNSVTCLDLIQKMEERLNIVEQKHNKLVDYFDQLVVRFNEIRP